MKNAIILEQNSKVYLISDYDGYVHSVWSMRERADNMLSILDADAEFDFHIVEYDLDEDSGERIGFEVLVNINNGEQVEDDYIKMHQTCIFIEGEEIENSPFPYNFVHNRPAANSGFLPRKINGKWCTNRLEVDWVECFRTKDYEETLEECRVSCQAITKEAAIDLARQFSEEILRELNSRSEWIISEEVVYE